MAILEILALAIRGLQFFFAIIVLGLTGHIASYGLVPSQDSFMVFVAVWTFLVVIFLALAPKFLSSIAHPFVILGLDALTMLFWFAGFIALAVYDHNIHNIVLGDIYGDEFQGCALVGNYCGEMTAAVVFGAFEWALFAITTALSAIEAMRGGRSKSGPMTSGPVA